MATKPIIPSVKSKPISLTNHSFLFWLALPIVILWLSFGYVVGIIKDRPIWATNHTSSQTNSVVPYFQTISPVPTGNKPAYITLWFDDAWLSQYLKAYPMLSSFGYIGAVAVPANSIETPNYMNWAQLRILQKNGWEITNHSSEHDCKMDSWSKEKVESEYQNSRLVLWKQGLTSDIFATPCGVDSNAMRQLASKYFLAYRTVNPGYNDLDHLDLYDLKIRNLDDEISLEVVKAWIDEAELNHYWLILVFHKIDDASTDVGDEKYNISLVDLKSILEYVKSSQSQVVTPAQIILSRIK